MMGHMKRDKRNGRHTDAGKTDAYEITGLYPIGTDGRNECKPTNG